MAETRPLLKRTLDCRLLDVGTGVGGIALEAVDSCPELLVDGIDIWEPSLILVRQNVDASLNASRITIRHQDVSELEDGKRYSPVWLPTMFLSQTVLENALRRIAAASLSGSYLIAATYTLPDNKMARSFASLRTLRSGGQVMSARDMEELLQHHGYVNVESVPGPLATFTMGSLP